jgi:hypothetical protein
MFDILIYSQDRLACWWRMVRCWRHIKMLKRSARFIQEGGASSTKEGELALVCPSCPYPDINLPEDWKSAPLSIRYVLLYHTYYTGILTHSFSFIYSLFSMADCNFRLRNRAHKKGHRDESLGQDGAYFVKLPPFNEFIKNSIHDDDVSFSFFFCSSYSLRIHAYIYCP